MEYLVRHLAQALTLRKFFAQKKHELRMISGRESGERMNGIFRITLFVLIRDLGGPRFPGHEIPGNPRFIVAVHHG